MGNEVELLPCPFCGAAVMERHALWIADGDTDAIIHAEPTECGLECFTLGAADQGRTTRSAWNTRHRQAAVPEGFVLSDEIIERAVRAAYDDWSFKAFSPALSEASGVPLGEPIPYELSIAMGVDHAGLRRTVTSALRGIAAAPSPGVSEGER